MTVHAYKRKVRKNDKYAVINDHKHPSRSMMVHAYIWRLWGVMINAQWSTIISMYCDPPSIFVSMYHCILRCMLMIVGHHTCIVVYDGPWQSMLTKGKWGKMIHTWWSMIISIHRGLWWYMLHMEAMRGDDTCTVIDNHKHVSWSTFHM